MGALSKRDTCFLPNGTFTSGFGDHFLLQKFPGIKYGIWDLLENKINFLIFFANDVLTTNELFEHIEENNTFHLGGILGSLS